MIDNGKRHSQYVHKAIVMCMVPQYSFNHQYFITHRLCFFLMCHILVRHVTGIGLTLLTYFDIGNIKVQWWIKVIWTRQVKQLQGIGSSVERWNPPQTLPAYYTWRIHPRKTWCFILHELLRTLALKLNVRYHKLCYLENIILKLLIRSVACLIYNPNKAFEFSQYVTEINPTQMFVIWNRDHYIVVKRVA